MNNTNINHWIPFTEDEVGAKGKFSSHFMTDYIRDNKITFTPAAQAVFDAGRELWKYYHAQPDANPNASLYDIRAYFQGRKENGRMNAKSDAPNFAPEKNDASRQSGSRIFAGLL